MYDRKIIEAKILDLNPWFYELEIFGIKVKPGVYPSKHKRDLSTRAHINRQKCRRTLLIDEVSKRFDFLGARLLDLGCNCGYWSSIYITKYGADSLVGIEGRELFIKQANLYYKSLGIQDKSLFIHSNVMKYDYHKWRKDAFDFVLCAGILYHVKDHEEWLTNISYINRKALVIDTRVSEKGEEYVEPNNLCFNAIKETRDKKVPKEDDLFNILYRLGYKIEIIPPRFKTMEGVNGPDDYNAGRRWILTRRHRRRICMFCEKVR